MPTIPPGSLTSARPSPRLRWSCQGASLVVLSSLCAAADAPNPPSDATPPAVTVPRLEADPEIQIDGVLDEPQWEKAVVVTGFHPYVPTEDFELEGKTTAKIFFTDQMIYFGFHCQSDHPERIRAHLNSREDINFDDQVGIYLDTYNDDRSAFVFYLNALGIQQDARLVENVSWNRSWDTVFHSKGLVSGDGYTVEVAIPFRSLRFPSTSTQTWGLILTRKFGAAGSKAIWPKVTRNRSSMLEQAADLSGLDGVVSSKNIEILPTLVSQWGSVTDRDQYLLSPVNKAFENGASVAPGLSLKYGLTSHLTLDVTVNPDFSQVESDPNKLELNRRAALYYSERRPFFLEGFETLSGAPYLSLHSRTIVSPLWGLKLTGKQGKTSIGFLTAYDTSPQPSFSHIVGRDRPGATPYTPGFMEGDLLNEDGTSRGAMVTVARVARDIGPGSVIGATVTDKEVMDLFGTGGAYGYNRLGMLDAQLRLGEHDRIVLATELSQTGMRGGDEMSAPGYFASWNHTRKVFYLQLEHGYEPPEFRAETAFLPLTGVMYTDIYAHYRFEGPAKGVQIIQPKIYSRVFFDPTAVPATTDFQIGPGLYARFADQMYLDAFYSRQWEYWGETFEEGTLGIFLWSNKWRWFSWFAGIYEGDRLLYGETADESYLGYATNPSARVTLRPLSWLKTTLAYEQELFLESPRMSLAYLADTLKGDEVVDRVYNQSVLRGVLNLTFSQAWSLRGILQAATLTMQTTEEDPETLLTAESNYRDTDLAWNVLLTYLPHPGTAVYLGVSQGRQRTEQIWLSDQAPWYLEEDQQWRVFLKLSYLWRI